MKLLITEHQGTPVVDTRVIAEQCDIQHQNAYELLKDHQALFEEELGLLRFETGAVKTEGARGVKYVKFALLTEDQATALITMFKNTEVVVRFKVRLAKAFGELKRERKTKLPNYRELLRLAAEQGHQLEIADKIMDKVFPLHEYGSISPTGRPRIGIRRAAFVAAGNRLKDAAHLLQLSAQLELELEGLE